MKLTIPELSLVALVGPSGSGKSTFARRHFRPTEVLSSDYFRGLISDNENDQAVSKEAFETLHYVAAKRLAGGRLTVVDATNVQEEARRPLVQLARAHDCLPVAIVFNLPEQVCVERNAQRPDRDFGARIVRQHRMQLRRSLRNLKREGFRYVYVFDRVEEVDHAEVERQPLWNNLRHEHGPFDIIGDVHGCFDELVELLTQMGYRVEQVDGKGGVPGDSEGSARAGKGQGSGNTGGTPVPQRGEGNKSAQKVGQGAELATEGGGAWFRVAPPTGRKAIFVGDLVDRGPDVVNVLKLVMSMVRSGAALCVPGNHDEKLLRLLRGKHVKLAHGLAETSAQLETEPESFRESVRDFLESLVSHYVLDEGKLVVAHAGMKEQYQGRGSGRVREFALYGETTGETDEFGLPIRINWAADYRGRAMVVYGHTPVESPQWLNGTLNIDTGCVFGGALTALRYPERETVSVPAKRMYWEPANLRARGDGDAPAGGAAGRSAQQVHDDVLDLSDMLGKRVISTRLHHTIMIREDQGTAALEVLSRFSVDPKWLIYLPPTMSPCETAPEGELLERPQEAFAYFRHLGVPRVICEEKHMGSRAVVIVCRDDGVARRRFGVLEDAPGVCYTRTGRRFFDDGVRERELLERVRSAMVASGLWDELQTDWVCLDCELMPWSAKAQGLLREQYAAVGAAAREALAAVSGSLEAAKHRGAGVDSLVERYSSVSDASRQFVDAYRRYCWPVESVDDLKLAPFHLLASEGRVHMNRDHCWHMDMLGRLCAADAKLLLATPWKVVDLSDGQSEAEATQWWHDLTASGGEGMVIKPLDFIARSDRGLVQPAVKCRGREYLRIIYGPTYTLPENIERLRRRGLGSKRGLALREFALGLEGLYRFVEREPLRRVHECAAGVLAMESVPVDPRL